MIFKKDKFWFGCILGFVAPILGILLFKYFKFQGYSYKDVFHFMIFEEADHRTLSVALTLSLLLNAALFTTYINTSRDNTAKGIFTTTMFYGLIILLIKTFV
jgi:hypothetical protein